MAKMLHRELSEHELGLDLPLVHFINRFFRLEMSARSGAIVHSKLCINLVFYRWTAGKFSRVRCITITMRFAYRAHLNCKLTNPSHWISVDAMALAVLPTFCHSQSISRQYENRLFRLGDFRERHFRECNRAMALSAAAFKITKRKAFSAREQVNILQDFL